jgi:isopentenyl diphosphate isomerase/L-lactate dehydrogenase-like FMN-dependent dehydrogenase
MTGAVDLSELKTIDQVIKRARTVADRGGHVWATAGAGQGVTTTRNTLALNRLALVPRMLRDVSRVDTGTAFAGVSMEFPVMLAPVAALGLFDPGDALAAATAATEMGTSAFCGMLTSSSWEEVAATSPGRHFFQLYAFGDRGWAGDVADRVQEAGFAALCLTVDSPVIGRRDRSLEDSFTWSIPSGDSINLGRHGLDYDFRATLTWADLAWLCQRTDLPVIVKGVMTPDDALEAVECGVAGIYVSNHGGRMVDQGLSSIEVLSEIVEAVRGQADVAVDSGFTRGAEVCKALAMGAKAVGIGRLQCWGLAVGGAPGLVRVLEILRAEIETTMANIGCPAIADITPAHVRWSIPAPPPVL